MLPTSTVTYLDNYLPFCSLSSLSEAQLFLNPSQSAVKGIHAAGFFICSVNTHMYYTEGLSKRIPNVDGAASERALVARTSASSFLSFSCSGKH